LLVAGSSRAHASSIVINGDFESGDVSWTGPLPSIQSIPGLTAFTPLVFSAFSYDNVFLDDAVVEASSVPEPGTMALVGVGLLLAARRRLLNR
jgi:hypothetical protein